VPRYTKRGWSVLNVTHHTGRRSVADVLGYVKEARAQVGPRRPVCLWGNSSGAHLAVLALELADADCVTAEGVPSMIKTRAELDRIAKVEPRYIEYWGDSPEEWRRWSPVTYASGGVFPGDPPISTTGLHGKVLVGTVPDDLATSPKEAELLRRANPAQVEHRVLATGPCRFAHTGAACAEKRAFYAREAEIMRAAEQRRATSP
jgi:acetyl esterase/lipase